MLKASGGGAGAVLHDRRPLEREDSRKRGLIRGRATSRAREAHKVTYDLNPNQNMQRRRYRIDGNPPPKIYPPARSKHPRLHERELLVVVVVVVLGSYGARAGSNHTIACFLCFTNTYFLSFFSGSQFCTNFVFLRILVSEIGEFRFLEQS